MYTNFGLRCLHQPGAWTQTHTTPVRYSVSWPSYTHTYALCRCRSLACYIIQRWVYQRLISSSLKTLKGCFVFLLPETPWTHRLPSSRGYLFTTAWICKSLSRLPAVTEGKRFTRFTSARRAEVSPHHFIHLPDLQIECLVTGFEHRQIKSKISRPVCTCDWLDLLYPQRYKRKSVVTVIQSRIET